MSRNYDIYHASFRSRTPAHEHVDAHAFTEGLLVDTHADAHVCTHTYTQVDAHVDPHVHTHVDTNGVRTCLHTCPYTFYMRV